MSLSVIKETIKRVVPRPVLEALVLSRRTEPRKLPNYRKYLRRVAGRKGIEIGGPSSLFKTILPLYQSVRYLDGVNFATETVWEGRIEAGRNFRFLDDRTGHQYISDATDLSEIASDSYDFLLSSNCLEHIANPLRALFEWRRVVRSGGAFVLVLPNKISNFDHNRPTTSFGHLLDDWNNRTTEHDLTHLEEILALHDLSMDPPAGDLEGFRTRSLGNFDNRTLHHHVFDLDVIGSLLRHAGFELICTTETQTDFFALSTKTR